MKAWSASVRRYPHFDPVISDADAEAVATDPVLVTTHTFYPFLKYEEGWNAYAEKGKTGKRKDRPIRFAARLDSCIFSYYRHLLSVPYEARLYAEGLDGSVIAYRRIPKVNGRGGQSNIDFALSAVEAVRLQGDCCTIALDISSFFETLDHDRLRKVWAELLGVSRLPNDHFQVFQAITRYAHVDVMVIPPFLTGLRSRIHAAIFSFCAGVMPPMPILGRSLLYVHSHCVANSCASSMLSMMYWSSHSCRTVRL